jgi:hypothetical protein
MDRQQRVRSRRAGVGWQLIRHLAARGDLPLGNRLPSLLRERAPNVLLAFGII